MHELEKKIDQLIHDIRVSIDKINIRIAMPHNDNVLLMHNCGKGK